MSEAEARATARTRQIEQWAEQVVSHTRAEEARLLHEQQQAKEAALAELRDLSDQRGRAIGSLTALREALGSGRRARRQGSRRRGRGVSRQAGP